MSTPNGATVSDLPDMPEPTVDIETEVHCAIGHASMCWAEPPTSEFDSDEALKVGDELVKTIRAYGLACFNAGRAEGGKDAWQPIETAPTPAYGFGAWILVCGHTSRTNANMQVVRWDGKDWESSDDGYGAYIKPTHWMPTPPAAMTKEKP